MGRKKRGSSPGPYLLDVAVDPRREQHVTDYSIGLPAIRGLGTLAFHPKVTFFVGENGSGKSTLLEALAYACGLNAEGGSQNFDFTTRETHSKLHRGLKIGRDVIWPEDYFFLRAESFYNVATEIDRLDEKPSFDAPLVTAYGGTSLHQQSHGESFFAVFEHRFKPCGLFFLDEPEAALSPMRQVQFLQVMHRHLKTGSQFVIATHSPILMGYPDATIYHFSAAGVKRVEYQATEHYLVTRGFLTNPKRTLDAILADSEPD